MQKKLLKRIIQTTGNDANGNVYPDDRLEQNERTLLSNLDN